VIDGSAAVTPATLGVAALLAALLVNSATVANARTARSARH